MRVAEDYSPHWQHDTLTPFAPVFTKLDPDTGRTVPFPLTSLTITMRMREQETGVAWDCAGEWVIDAALDGQAHYVFLDDDVRLPGLYEMQLTLTDSEGAFAHSDVLLMEIKEAI